MLLAFTEKVGAGGVLFRIKFQESVAASTNVNWYWTVNVPKDVTTVPVPAVTCVNVPVPPPVQFSVKKSVAVNVKFWAGTDGFVNV